MPVSTLALFNSDLGGVSPEAFERASQTGLEVSRGAVESNIRQRAIIESLKEIGAPAVRVLVVFAGSAVLMEPPEHLGRFSVY